MFFPRTPAEEIAHAVHSGVKHSIRNAMSDGNTLYLYGHPIFDQLGLHKELNQFSITLAGVNRRTARRYINAVLSGTDWSVFNKANKPHLRGPTGRSFEIDPCKVYVFRENEKFQFEMITHFDYCGRTLSQEEREIVERL